MLDARGKGLKVPEVAQSPQNRCSREGHSLAVSILTLLLDLCLGNPGGDQQGRDATTQTVKGEGVVFATGGAESKGQVIRPGSERSGDVVVEATALVEGQDEEGLLPLGTGAQSIVDLLDESLAIGDQAGRMHGGGANSAARGIEVRQFGKGTSRSVSVELGQGLDLVLVVGSIGPVEVACIRAGTAGRVDIVDPRVTGLGQLLEDGPLGELVLGKSSVVQTVAEGGTRNQGGTVGVGVLQSQSASCKGQRHKILTPGISECQWLKVR